MKQALALINEIKLDYDALIKSKSPYLKKDREKHIKALKRDLKEYCYYKGFNFKYLCEQHNI